MVEKGRLGVERQPSRNKEQGKGWFSYFERPFLCCWVTNAWAMDNFYASTYVQAVPLYPRLNTHWLALCCYLLLLGL